MLNPVSNAVPETGDFYDWACWILVEMMENELLAVYVFCGESMLSHDDM
jgi:hypothetical protein